MTTAPSPADLSKLHDFYQPAPVSWAPHTIGWWVVFGVLALLVLWFAVHEIRRWLRNKYRREALRELATTSPEHFSTLLKRTAIVAWPRERVASLSGEKWIGFLAQSSSINTFEESPGNRIEQVALSAAALSTEDRDKLRDLAAQWIRRHRVQD